MIGRRLSVFVVMGLVLAGAVAARAVETPATNAASTLVVASVFSDHMVLQQGMPLPVWGTAKPGDTVTVVFTSGGAANAPQRKSAKAGDDGKWSVSLDPLKASADAATMTVTASGEPQPATFADVLVGEVWIGSGQSNMQFGLNRAANGAAAIAAAGDPLLRLFDVTLATSDTPLSRVGGKWAVCTPESAGNFSAVGYFFARDLRKALGVPVGIFRSSWGGTPAQAWTPRAALEADTNLAVALTRYAEELARWDPAKAEADYKVRLAAHTQAVAKAKAAGTKAPQTPRRPAEPNKSPNRPSCLYNAMIAPLQPFAIRGVIWYQGESDSGRAAAYPRLMEALISSWRQVWGQDMPFLFVQIAPHQGMCPEIREAQLKTLMTVPKTGMAVTTDVGDAKDIHPTAKEPVGARLALAARAVAYGEAIEYSGPVYDALTVEGDKAIVRFTHVGGGLTAREGGLTGFTIAGDNRVFTNAVASIEGATVVVHSPDVTKPVAVRYGWANVPVCNLTNREGLPASPFRTDDWGAVAPTNMPAPSAPAAPAATAR